MKIGGDFSIVFPLFVSVKGSEFQAFYETAIFPLILCPPYPLKLNPLTFLLFQLSFHNIYPNSFPPRSVRSFCGPS